MEKNDIYPLNAHKQANVQWTILKQAQGRGYVLETQIWAVILEVI